MLFSLYATAACSFTVAGMLNYQGHYEFVGVAGNNAEQVQRSRCRCPPKYYDQWGLGRLPEDVIGMSVLIYVGSSSTAVSYNVMLGATALPHALHLTTDVNPTSIVSAIHRMSTVHTNAQQALLLPGDL